MNFVKEKFQLLNRFTKSHKRRYVSELFSVSYSSYELIRFKILNKLIKSELGNFNFKNLQTSSKVIHQFSIFKTF